MVQVYLGIGSNREKEANIRSCLDALRQEFGEIIVSDIYQSQSYGFTGADFFNLAVCIETQLSVGQLSKQLKKIEDTHGRVRKQYHEMGDRTLDIDILFYGNAIGIFEGVQLPRSEVTENAYVLCPLAEIAPDLLHPLVGRTLQELWAAYDQSRQPLVKVHL